MTWPRVVLYQKAPAAKFRSWDHLRYSDVGDVLSSKASDLLKRGRSRKSS